MEVPKLGAKSFQQAAGFLRIHDGEEPLDQTPIHPESYQAAHRLCQLFGISQLGSDECREKLSQLNLEKTAEQLEVSPEIWILINRLKVALHVRI